MKNLFNSLRFIFKALLLITIFALWWASFNILNLFKGKQERQDAFSPANADYPPPQGDCGACGCPHVAYFDGKEFKIENDFLLGKPKSFFTDYGLIKSLYERGLVGPDLLKFQNIPQKRNGKLVLQLQEIEEEETFIDWIKLFRVVHPKGSEVVPDSEFKKFYVFDKKDAEEKAVLPTYAALNGNTGIISHFQKIKHLWTDPNESEDRLFQANDRLELTFQGLKQGEVPLLVIKSMFRDWMMGEERQPKKNFFVSSLFGSPVVIRTAMIFIGAAFLLLQRKSMGSLFAVTPFIIGGGDCGTGPDCGGGPGACGNDQCKSLIFSYAGANNAFRRLSVHEPRDWRHGTEVIEFPRQAISPEGTMTVRIDFTKRHKLSFAGILQNAVEVTYKDETLKLKRAVHSRIGDITESLNEEKIGEYGHMIPGDIIDVEFEEPEIPMQKYWQETYLMQSSGFYTQLRRQSKRIAGNWSGKISEEAKSHYRELISLRSYH